MGKIILLLLVSSSALAQVHFKLDTTLTLDAQDAVNNYIVKHCKNLSNLKEETTLTDVYKGEHDVLNSYSTSQISGLKKETLNHFTKVQLVLQTADYTGDGPSIVTISLIDSNPEKICQ